MRLSELNEYQLFDMASGTIDARYFFFSGTYTVDTVVIDGRTVYYNSPTFNWPAEIVTRADLIPSFRNKVAYTYSFICGCYDYEEDPVPPDSARLADGIGYLHKIYPPSPGWSYWAGYNNYLTHAHPCIVYPCPGGGGVDYKRAFVFTDSPYNELPDDVLLSGASRLYFKGYHSGGLSGSYVKLYLETDPANDITVQLTYDGDEAWRGSIENSKVLGLKSFNKVIGLYQEIRQDNTDWFLDSAYVYVGLPRIATSVDTVIIRTDSMKISDDFIAALYFEDDYSGNKISAHTRIDSAGYRYSSFWVANSNRPPVSRQRYERDYPSDSTYLWWDNSTYAAAVTFWRDSLYVVGGSLSVNCVGAMTPIPNIDNSFTATTDTVINDTPRATKLILVNGEAPNLSISHQLADDIVRAMAYQESNWHNYSNNYPLEHHIYTMTGMMQISRYWWENVFNGTDDDGLPDSYFLCKWDSLAWNWTLNVNNGRYIYHDVNFKKMTEKQKTWDSLYFPQNDYTPDFTNREDLSSYGYHEGWPTMRFVTADNWHERIWEHTYVVNIRKRKDLKPWE